MRMAAGLRWMFGLGVALAPPVHATVCRVTTAGMSGNTGADWNSPLDLPSALGSASCSEIWVKAGIYKPAGAGSRDTSFVINPGVAVYGGFAGNEASRDSRDPERNLTVLSGDIDNNDSVDGNGIDTSTAHINGNNSYHVVVIDGVNSGPVDISTVLDGFTITGGQANGSGGDPVLNIDRGWGGGLYCYGAGSGDACSPRLGNLVFQGNLANNGGALYVDGRNGGDSSPEMTVVTFSGNAAQVSGGAIYFDGSGSSGHCNPYLIDVEFDDNSALVGGALRIDGSSGGRCSPIFNRAAFIRNLVSANGGAVYSGASNGSTGPLFANATFNDNSASSSGGAIYDSATSSGDASMTLANVTLSGNQAGSYGGAIYSAADNNATLITLGNTILWGDTVGPGGQGPELYNPSASVQIDDSIVQGGCPGGGFGATCNSNIIDSDPLLAAPAANGGRTQSMMPASGSPAIDSGNDATCRSDDQRGLARPLGAHCDMGAVESDEIFRNGFEALP